MAIHQEHEFVLNTIATGAFTGSLSLIAARTVKGTQRVVLCFLLTAPDGDSYIPLAVLSNSDDGDLIRDLVWPQLGCRVFMEPQEGEVDLLD